jgi:hypothetical protein
MQIIPILIIGGLVMLSCWGVDKLFQKLFRSKAQHRSGKAVRASKRYGTIGVILAALGIGACFAEGLLIPGLLVLALGIGLCAYYLSVGIFYNEETFLVCAPFKKDREYAYRDIKGQQLYLIAGGGNSLCANRAELIHLSVKRAQVLFSICNLTLQSIPFRRVRFAAQLHLPCSFFERFEALLGAVDGRVQISEFLLEQFGIPRIQLQQLIDVAQIVLALTRRPVNVCQCLG